MDIIPRLNGGATHDPRGSQALRRAGRRACLTRNNPAGPGKINKSILLDPEEYPSHGKIDVLFELYGNRQNWAQSARQLAARLNRRVGTRIRLARPEKIRRRGPPTGTRRRGRNRVRRPGPHPVAGAIPSGSIGPGTNKSQRGDPDLFRGDPVVVLEALLVTEKDISRSYHLANPCWPEQGRAQ